MRQLKEYLTEGYSGYEWVESDTCADMLAGIFDDINDVIYKKVNDFVNKQHDTTSKSLACFDAANAILFFFDMYANNKREYDITDDLCDLCISFIESAQEDTEMQSTWDNPEEFTDHLDKMMEKAVQYKAIADKHNR